MVKLERVYNVPLRREWLKAPPYKRAKKAVAAVRQFLMRHMKGEQVKLGSHLNEAIWERGIKKPPHHVKVTAIKDDDGVVRAELFGFALEAPKKEEKKGALEGLKEKLIGGRQKKPAKEAKATEAKAPAAAKGKEPASPGTLEEAAEKASAIAPPPAGSASLGEAAPKRRKGEKKPSAAKGVKGADEA